MANEERQTIGCVKQHDCKNFRVKCSDCFEWADIINQHPCYEHRDLVEVVHGRWEECPDEYGICATEFTCSECKESWCNGEMSDVDFRAMMKYCPNCGAKMDGDGDG